MQHVRQSTDRCYYRFSLDTRVSMEARSSNHSLVVYSLSWYLCWLYLFFDQVTESCIDVKPHTTATGCSYGYQWNL